jgi:hypothetical protein
MNFIKFLYYKYYKFQLKVGNEDIAPFSAVLIIAFTLMLYYFDFLFFYIVIFPESNIYNGITESLTVLALLIICFYFLLYHKGKYKRIIKSMEKEYGSKKSFLHILFPLLAFILYNLGWILKMLQNQGKL